MSANFDVELDSMYSNLNEKFEGFNAHVEKLDSQVVHNTGLVRREEGFFRGRTDTNQRHLVNVITLRSGRQLNPHPRKEMEKLDRAEELEEVQSDPDEKEAESEIDKIDNSLNVSIDTPSIRILNSLSLLNQLYQGYIDPRLPSLHPN